MFQKSGHAIKGLEAADQTQNTLDSSYVPNVDLLTDHPSSRKEKHSSAAKQPAKEIAFESA